jgi:hypothetical protein
LLQQFYSETLGTRFEIRNEHYRNSTPFDRFGIMAAGVTDRVWKMSDIAALIEAHEAPVAKRGPKTTKEA